MTQAVLPRGARWGLAAKPRALTWWLWSVTAVLLLTGLFFDERFRVFAMALSVAQAVVWLARYRSLGNFPTQVRVAYVAWMAASFLPGFAPFFWIQTLGTTSLVTVGYCPLARLLLLLPSNRSVPLTVARVWRIISHPPTQGSVRQELRI